RAQHPRSSPPRRLSPKQIPPLQKNRSECCPRSAGPNNRAGAEGEEMTPSQWTKVRSRRKKGCAANLDLRSGISGWHVVAVFWVVEPRQMNAYSRLSPGAITTAAGSATAREIFALVDDPGSE